MLRFKASLISKDFLLLTSPIEILPITALSFEYIDRYSDSFGCPKFIWLNFATLPTQNNLLLAKL